MTDPLTVEEEAALRAIPHAGSTEAADTIIAALIATLDHERVTHRRWVDATYGRDGADSVLLSKTQHAKLERAWYALTSVAQWDEVAVQMVAEIQAMES